MRKIAITKKSCSDRSFVYGVRIIDEDGYVDFDCVGLDSAIRFINKAYC